MEKSYTVREIDALRKATNEHLFVFPFRRDFLYNKEVYGHTSYFGPLFKQENRDKELEEKVRTYMLAGVTAEDLIEEDRILDEENQKRIEKDKPLYEESRKRAEEDQKKIEKILDSHLKPRYEDGSVYDSSIKHLEPSYIFPYR